MVATARGLSARTSFTLKEQIITGTTDPSPVPDALSAVHDNLQRVWQVGPTIESHWLFYVPHPAFSAVNSLKEMVPGELYWLKIMADQNATLNGKRRTLVQGWNLIVW